MRIIFTIHAQKRILDRGMNVEYILSLFKNNIPVNISNGLKTFAYKKLRIVYRKTENIIKVITVYWK